jgi:hypothetical protein
MVMMDGSTGRRRGPRLVSSSAAWGSGEEVKEPHRGGEGRG